MHRKPIVGLAGGIGAGKSTVARLLAERGAAVVASDRISAEELASREVRRALQVWWGPDAFDEAGNPDRGKIAEIIFSDPTQRKRLEALLHPRIAKRRRACLDACQADPDVRMIVLDTPLLFEAGLADECDWIIFVQASRQARQQRVQESRGWNEAELERRENSQKALEFKKGTADYIVVNESSMKVLASQIERVFSHILSKGCR